MRWQEREITVISCSNTKMRLWILELSHDQINYYLSSVWSEKKVDLHYQEKYWNNFLYRNFYKKWIVVFFNGWKIIWIDFSSAESFTSLRSLSRHKQSLFLYLASAIVEHFLERIASLRHWYINPNENSNKYTSLLLS